LSSVSHIFHIFNRKVPILAAGGVVTGDQLVSSLALGADGVAVGTGILFLRDLAFYFVFYLFFNIFYKNFIRILGNP
jgi:isopentenyl diphosphate isomerase/L-lactate dehydrogenase-like FMN-dependent dehydrogenase